MFIFFYLSLNLKVFYFCLLRVHVKDCMAHIGQRRWFEPHPHQIDILVWAYLIYFEFIIIIDLSRYLHAC